MQFGEIAHKNANFRLNIMLIMAFFNSRVWKLAYTYMRFKKKGKKKISNF